MLNGLRIAIAAVFAVTFASAALGQVGIQQIKASGTPSSSTYLRGDGAWATVGGGSVPFPSWGGGVAYAAGNIAMGSDGNDYVCTAATSSVNPATDNGSHWGLFYVNSSISLVGGSSSSGNRFAGTSSDPAGLQAMVNFVASCIGAQNGKTITLSVPDNPTFAISATSTTTSLKTTTNVAVGTEIYGVGGTSGNVDAISFVTGSSLSGGTYTLTVSPALPSPPATADTFAYAYYYGTSPIVISNLACGPFTTVQGDTTNTIVAPAFYPSLTTTTTGGSLGSAVFYVCLTYTTAYGETMAGPVTQISAGAGSTNTVTVAALSGLPAAITAVNYYFTDTSSPGSTAWKKVTATPSGGAVSAQTFSSYSGTTQPPQVNPPFPCVLQWGNSNGIEVTDTDGLTINGFQVLGDGTAGGASLYGFDVAVSKCLSVGAGCDLSAWGGYCVRVAAGQTVLSGTQIDYGVVGGVLCQFGSQVDCLAATALYCGTGFRGNNGGQVWSSNPITAANSQLYAYSCSTAFASNYGGYIQTDGAGTSIGSGTATLGFGCAVLASPALDTSGNAGSYISD